jgi:hypothetical protein
MADNLLCFMCNAKEKTKIRKHTVIIFLKVQISSPDHSTNSWNNGVESFDLSLNTCHRLLVMNPCV